MKPFGNICQGSACVGSTHCFNFLLGFCRNLASRGVEPSLPSLLCGHPACLVLPGKLSPTRFLLPLLSLAFFSFPGPAASCLSVSRAPRTCCCPGLFLLWYPWAWNCWVASGSRTRCHFSVASRSSLPPTHVPLSQ